MTDTTGGGLASSTEGPPERAERGTTVLVVDDSPTARSAMRALAESADGVERVMEAASGGEALEVVRAELPTVVLMDIHMPGMDGAAATRLIMSVAPRTRVIGYSSSLDPSDVRRALEAGATGYAVKSGTPEELRLMVAAAVEGRGALSTEIVRPVVHHYVELLERSRRRDRGIIESLAAAVEAKDAVTSDHLRRVGRLALDLALEIDPDLAHDEDFLYGCLLHDVGKIGVPEAILTKPAALDEGEWKIMHRHPLTGIRVIEPLELGDITRSVVLHHHEHWDGSGYPGRLAGDEIPLEARIFTLCDALDAMTSDRPYRRALGLDEALRRIRAERGVQFDPEVVDALLTALDAGHLSLDPSGHSVDGAAGDHPPP